MIAYELLPAAQFDEVAQTLFDLLADNMTRIAPTGNSREADYALWNGSAGAAIREGRRQMILMKDAGEIVGFFQYVVTPTLLMMDEIQIRPSHQGRDHIFRGLYGFLLAQIRSQPEWVEAYANKRNEKSIGILTHLGLEIVGENRNGNSWHFRGRYERLLNWFSQGSAS